MLPWHILMGGDRWCVLCLEVAEEPSSSRRSSARRGGAQLVAEEPSLSRRSPALQSKMGVWPWASMALGEYGLRPPLSFEICFNFEDEILNSLGRL
ncbi:hypothetical protein Syun_027051 [Stephania yunnanensis]|uniref:Uncharacterized protein n=1 Tax=Stephania yunnanensis TaxID=152371 RepID=A0AAP0EEY9_9MAGN